MTAILVFILGLQAVDLIAVEFRAAEHVWASKQVGV